MKIWQSITLVFLILTACFQQQSISELNKSVKTINKTDQIQTELIKNIYNNWNVILNQLEAFNRRLKGE